MESIGALIYDIGKALHDLHYLATSTQYKHPGISRGTLKMAKNCYITFTHARPTLGYTLLGVGLTQGRLIVSYRSLELHLDCYAKYQSEVVNDEHIYNWQQIFRTGTMPRKCPHKQIAMVL